MAMLSQIPRLMVAAASSGSGKTTVTCALMRALRNKKIAVSSFKCGPDYIDPMFHRQSLGSDYCGNLDTFLSDTGTVRRLLAQRGDGCALALIEGVMGYYDGVASTSEASSYEIARETNTPVALLVDCRGGALSIAAQVRGFYSFRPDSNIAAVILNRVSKSYYPELKTLIERECGVPVAGYMPVMPDCELKSRRLGLVVPNEVSGLEPRLERLGKQAAISLDLELLMSIASEAPLLSWDGGERELRAAPLRIAVAQDEAFSFYYDDSLDLLKRMGARLVPFSPLEDEKIPENVCGLLLGGGYPEIYAAQLSENETMRESVKRAVRGNLPTIAECGGFIYLHRLVRDEANESYPMAGVFDAEAAGKEKLSRFGYVTLTAKRGGMLADLGGSLPAHEFHYWDSNAPGTDFTAQKPHRTTNWSCGYTGKALYAGFPHLYFPGCPEAARKFMGAAADYGKKRVKA